jgi:hypothetical protein
MLIFSVHHYGFILRSSGETKQKYAKILVCKDNEQGNTSDCASGRCTEEVVQLGQQTIRIKASAIN